MRKCCTLTLTEEILSNLYYTQGETLEQIGQRYNVTRERIRQLMEGYGLPRRKDFVRWSPRKYTSIEDYFNNGNRKDIRRDIVKKLIVNLSCCKCGSERHLHIHHKVYPARKPDDIEVLCASCHGLTHRSGLTYQDHKNIYNKHKEGRKASTLAREYGLSEISIYKILAKIKRGQHTIRQ